MNTKETKIEILSRPSSIIHGLRVDGPMFVADDDGNGGEIPNTARNKWYVYREMSPAELRKAKSEHDHAKDFISEFGARKYREIFGTKVIGEIFQPEGDSRYRIYHEQPFMSLGSLEDAVFCIKENERNFEAIEKAKESMEKFRREISLSIHAMVNKNVLEKRSS